MQPLCNQVATRCNYFAHYLHYASTNLQFVATKLKSFITTGSYITTDAFKAGKLMENQVGKTLEMKAWTSDIQRKCQIIAKLNKDLESLRESKEKLELELNAFKAEKLHNAVWPWAI